MINRVIYLVVGLSMSIGFAVPMMGQQQSSEDLRVNLPQETVDKVNQLMDQGQILAGQRDYVKAQDAFRKASILAPNLAMIHCALGGAYLSCGNMTEAFKQYQEALRIDPNDAQTALGLGLYYIAESNAKEAAVWLQKCIDDKPEYPDVLKRAKDTLVVIRRERIGSGDPNSADYFDNSLTIAGSLYRWLPSDVPLKVFIEPGNGVLHYRAEFRSMLVDAFNAWTAATNGKLSWVEVDKESAANILCRWQTEPDSSGEGGSANLGTVAVNGRHIIKNAIIKVFTQEAKQTEEGYMPVSAAYANQVCFHEVGHALGMPHSPNKNDIMFAMSFEPNSPSAILSGRDKNTIQRLYESH
jgi:tetratricopeptide (TPR) repeat protein